VVVVGDGLPDRDASPLPARRWDDMGERKLARRFGDALRAGDPQGAALAAEAALESGMDVPALHSRVIEPAMQRIGELWQRGAATVADEHLATAISDSVLGRVFPQVLRAPPRSRERVLLAAAPGEQHVLGLRMVADVLEGAGFDVLCLGADVPPAGLLDACQAHKPAVLGLSVTMALHVPPLLQAIEVVAALDPAPAIVVAGRAARLAIRQGLCVPLVEHSEHVVAVVEQLLAAPRRGQVVSSVLSAKLPEGASTAHDGGRSLLTMEGAFAETTLAAVDSARASGRHAYAMERLAYHDALTGLWNRRAYDDRFHELVGADAAGGSILMIDVDHFKGINDTYGHEVGDRALINVARAIVRAIRHGDFAARCGGDEFSVLMPGADIDEALAIGERFRATVERELRDPALTVSVGVTPLRMDQRDTALAVDKALYDAKESGRNRVVATAG